MSRFMFAERSMKLSLLFVLTLRAVGIDGASFRGGVYSSRCPCGDAYSCERDGALFIASRIRLLDRPFLKSFSDCIPSDPFCVVSNQSLKLQLGFRVYNYSAEEFAVWQNESSLSVEWKPEAHDSLVPLRYPPLIQEFPIVHGHGKHSSLIFTMFFSDINMKMRSRYEIKVRMAYFRDCHQMVSLNSPETTLEVLFACENILGATCNESITESVTASCGLAENLTMAFGEDSGYEVTFDVSRLPTSKRKNRNLKYFVVYGNCSKFDSLFWNDFCRLNAVDALFEPICPNDTNQRECDKQSGVTVSIPRSTASPYGFDVCAFDGSELDFSGIFHSKSRIVRQLQFPLGDARFTFVDGMIASFAHFAVYAVVFAVLLALVVCSTCTRFRHKRSHLIVVPDDETDLWELGEFDVNILYENRLGSGAFGTVFLGILSKDYYQSTASKELFVDSLQQVAVKVLKENAEQYARLCLLEEMAVNKEIGHHARLVNMLGVRTVREPLCMVMEYCSKGDLLNYLRDRCHYMIKMQEMGVNFEGDDLENGEIDLDMVVSVKHILRFACEISEAMGYLSERGFIHRDLAARNVLVTADDTLKVGDFGMCRRIDASDHYYRGHGGNLPVKWMSPEAIAAFEFSVKSDVWSFGVVLFELVTLGGSPYSSIPPCDLLKRLNDGYRIPKPNNCGDRLYALMCQCWKQNPVERPTFKRIRKFLVEMYEMPGRDNTSEYYLKLDRSEEYYDVLEFKKAKEACREVKFEETKRIGDELKAPIAVDDDADDSCDESECATALHSDKQRLLPPGL